MKKELQQLLLKQQEEQTYHLPMEEEFAFYRDIASGNLEVLKGNTALVPTKGMGVLSPSPLQNHKYHIVILTAMITRFCIEAGLDPEHAYTLSDLFIRKVDACTKISQLGLIKKDIISEFTQTMHELHQGKTHLSYHAARAVSYINAHLNEPLKAYDVAESLSLHPDYLSRLLKSETGYTLSDLILQKKCETACYMLKNSTSSCTEIGLFLGFSSGSHFGNCFKKIYGITPAAYRKTTTLY